MSVTPRQRKYGAAQDARQIREETGIEPIKVWYDDERDYVVLEFDAAGHQTYKVYAIYRDDQDACMPPTFQTRSALTTWIRSELKKPQQICSDTCSTPL